jgi:hypothetical protein
MTDEVMEGAVCKILRAGASFFITPRGVDASDRSLTVYCHAKALERSGIAADSVSLGTRLRFKTKPPRHADDRREAYDLEAL